MNNNDTLQNRISELENNINDLEISLTTTIEHGDIIEDELTQNNNQLQVEIEHRITAETRLKKLVTLITQQKSDLEILIDTIVEHSDNMDFEWLEQIQIVEHDSLTDVLTGIGNRRSFDNYFSNEWKRSIRINSSFSLIMLDIDFFKRFNDLHGHAEGDRCLKKIAYICEQCLSRPADLITRYGGEEFTVILPDTDIEGANTIAQELISAVQNSQIPHGDSSASEFVSISLGVNSCQPNVKSDSSYFLHHTDQLLYKAKENGRNQIISPSSPIDYKSSAVSSYGHFKHLHDYQKLENLSLSFIPSSIPIKQRWRNNGLSADFLADYMSTFFPQSKKDLKVKRLHSEINAAVSFIANELLENAMKYTSSDCHLPSGINLFLDEKAFVFEAFNYIDQADQEKYTQFINVIQNSDTDKLFMQQLEINALNNQSSGLGILTMINDYGATIAWKFILTNKNYIRTTTQVTLKL